MITVELVVVAMLFDALWFLTSRRHEGLHRVTDSSSRCPFCGAPMVMRTRKSDGGHFYGCSTYPKCKGIVNIRERI